MSERPNDGYGQRVLQEGTLVRFEISKSFCGDRTGEIYLVTCNDIHGLVYHIEDEDENRYQIPKRRIEEVLEE